MDDDVSLLRVAGVSHYQTAVERCVPGEAVRFVHEPDNPYDCTALRVVSLLNETIGYVPRASWVHRLIHENGRGVSAVIASVGMGRACLYGVTLSIAITDDAPAIDSYFPDGDPPEPPPGGFRYWIKVPSVAGPLVAERK